MQKSHPISVRGAYYQATVHGICEKTEAGYRQVQTDLVKMRVSDVLPYSWISDSTRWQRKPITHNNIQEALEATARLYRKALWNDIDAYVEIWIEKDALAGVIYPITSKYDVALMSARNYASLSFLHSAAEYIAALGKPTFIYHLGDYDPSGVNAAESIEKTLRKIAPQAEIHFERLAVTREQITAWDLPTRPTKQTDTRAKNFGDVSVELDAIEPGVLRRLVEKVINKHLPARQLRVQQAAEESEREFLTRFIEGDR